MICASCRDIIQAIPEINYICVDVANGYSEHFVEFVRLVRKEFPDKTIFVRNALAESEHLLIFVRVAAVCRRAMW